MNLTELLYIKPIGKLSERGVFFMIIILYLCSIFYYYWQFKTFGAIDGYEVGNNIMSLLFAPIYEEVLFRGIILLGLLKIFNDQKRVILWGGILFGIWHLKNFPFLELDFSQNGLYRQVVYTAFLGSFLTYLALRYKTIWLGVMIHYLNNIFLAPVSFLLIKLI